MQAEPSAVLSQVEKILGHALFARSERMSRFLRLAVECTLQGKAEQLKEYVIGREVFDRPGSYDPRSDPIVRVEARRLRSKLKAYYEGDGREDPILLELETGTYVPRIRRRGEPAPAPAGAPKSIAVLYFENLGPADEQSYFRDGVTEDIITELTKIEGLRVFPRSAVLAYRDRNMSSGEIARKLPAAFLLEGSLRRAGERVRVSVQLVETSSGHSIWAERYDHELKDIFDVQDHIARRIAQALRVALYPRAARKPTSSPQAYDYYLRGRSYARRCTRPDLEFAFQMFEHAIALDDRFALAHAGLANTYGFFCDWHERDDRWLEKSREACERALALDPGLAEALAASARIHKSRRRYGEAIREAREAIRRKPDCEGAYWTLGQSLFLTDCWQEAVEMAPRAVEASGDDYNVYVPLFSSAERLGQAELAEQLRRQQAEALERHLEWAPDDVRARVLLACARAHFGQEQEARRELERAMSLRPNDSNILYNAACVYGILRQPERALEYLKRADEAGLAKWDWAARDPDLLCLRGDPEFERLVREGCLAEMSRGGG